MLDRHRRYRRNRHRDGSRREPPVRRLARVEDSRSVRCAGDRESGTAPRARSSRCTGRRASPSGVRTECGREPEGNLNRVCRCGHPFEAHSRHRPGTDGSLCECPRFVWRRVLSLRRYLTRRTGDGHGRRDGDRRGDDVPREGHQLLTAPALPCWQLSSSAPGSGDRFASPMVLSSAEPGGTSSTCPAHCSTPAGKPTG